MGASKRETLGFRSPPTAWCVLINHRLLAGTELREASLCKCQTARLLATISDSLPTQKIFLKSWCLSDVLSQGDYLPMTIANSNSGTKIGTFPFGQPVQEVVQTDRTPKDVFVLGVYASAVHARWIDTNENTVVNALAVASEPYIFWRGDDAESIIQQIRVPKELGKLIPARHEFNGPSGQALDNLILNPLGLDRQKVWLCDLVPYSCGNSSQIRAIEQAYLPIVQRFGLVNPSVPPIPNIMTTENRRIAIMDEFIESEARVLILLGDKPIQWFLTYSDNRWNKLADFGRDSKTYGRLHNTDVGSKDIQVLPLAHPRQIAKLGQSSSVWYNLHETWLEQFARKIG